MTRGKILVITLGVAGGLLLGLSAGSRAASLQARQAVTPTTTALSRLPPPPPIVGYPPQIYMFGPPPGVVGPAFGLNGGFKGTENREVHRFDRPFESFHDH